MVIEYSVHIGNSEGVLANFANPKGMFYSVGPRAWRLGRHRLKSFMSFNKNCGDTNLTDRKSVV